MCVTYDMDISSNQIKQIITLLARTPIQGSEATDVAILLQELNQKLQESAKNERNSK